MTPEHKQCLDALLDQQEALSDDIIATARERLGSVPYIYTALRCRPESFVLSALADEKICRPPHLSAKTAELVAIAAAATTGAEACLHVHILAARRAGATRDEILDVIQIAALIAKTGVLGSALRTLDATDADSAVGNE